MNGVPESEESLDDGRQPRIYTIDERTALIKMVIDMSTLVW